MKVWRLGCKHQVLWFVKCTCHITSSQHVNSFQAVRISGETFP